MTSKEVCVKWLDACQTKFDKGYVESLTSGKELLPTNTTYGKILKLLDDVVIILHEESTINTDLDITVIPRSWVVSPKKYRSI